MPAFTVQLNDNQAIFISIVSVPGQPLIQAQRCASLLDTGAQRTLISKRVADALGLVPSGPAPITPVSGETIMCNEYKIRLDIPVTTPTETDFRGKEIDVVELPYQPHNYDVLLGMDFLSVFHITFFNQQFILST